jgi:predicted transcriptional regulator
MSRTKSPSLTKRDLDIMTILWNSDVSMTASEIVASDPGLNINTVQAVLRKLLKSNYIEVADIVYSGTVLSRSYRPTVSQNDFALSTITTEYQKLGNQMTKASLLASLLDAEPDKEKRKQDIAQLKEMLRQYQEKESK